jgi:hypothetical protein
MMKAPLIDSDNRNNRENMTHIPLDSLPYLEVTEEDYAVRAARTFSTERLKAGTTLLHGVCPRCEAQITSPLVSLIFRDDEPPEDGEFHVVFCTCDHPHPDRPEGRAGCGAYWAFLL